MFHSEFDMSWLVVISKAHVKQVICVDWSIPFTRRITLGKCRLHDVVAVLGNKYNQVVGMHFLGKGESHQELGSPLWRLVKRYLELFDKVCCIQHLLQTCIALYQH